MAKQIEAIASQTLAAEITHVPSIEADIQIPSSTEATIAPPVIQLPSPADLWKGFFKEATEKLEPKETPFLLDSGEACVTIPNAVVEKNKKA